MTSAALEIRGLGKTFATRRGEVVALDGIDVTLEPNEFVCLVGASGCGKSTLLSIVAGLEAQTTGEVSFDGAPIQGPGRDRGVVFQGYTLFPWLTARQNIEFGLRGQRMKKQERSRRACEHLELVGLGDFADSHPRELSGGMKQRVAIARALSYRPRVLLMDEPFGALDALSRRSMQELLTQVWEAHRLTVLFVTHDVEEAVFLADRVLVMTSRPGRIKEEITVDLPRPRTFEMLGSGKFGATKLVVLESIRDETMVASG